jgi:hypothetical protein
VGMALEKHICVALFARYDRQRRGYIDYTEFIDHLMEKVFFTPEEAKHIGSKVEVLRLHLKKNGTLKDLDALVQDKTPLRQVRAIFLMLVLLKIYICKYLLRIVNQIEYIYVSFLNKQKQNKTYTKQTQ